MKVLFACHRLPFPPTRGGKIRPFNIIRHLTESGHRVSVATLARSAEELEQGRELSRFCEKLLVGSVGKASAALHTAGRLLTGTPSSMGYFFSRDLHRRARSEQRAGEYDLVFVHCSSAAQYVSTGNGSASIIDFGDMDSQKWLDYSSSRAFPLALGYRLEAAKLCREEKRLARRFDLSTCTTAAELETLRRYGAARRSAWFPNGVDSEFFKPTDAPFDPDLVTFVGRMDYYPNQQAVLEFCRTILPRIRHERPATRLAIVGAEPSARIRALARQPGVTVTGTVPDVRPHVCNAAVSIAPLSIARGTQNKILESMAMGVPVVCSSVAAKGVDAVADEHLLVADSPEGFAAAVLRLLEQPLERARLARAARERVLSHHSWSASMHRLGDLIESVTADRS